MRANHFFYLITAMGLVLTTQASAIETRYVTLSANLDERTATVGALPPVEATFDELAAGSQFQASVAVIDATSTRHVLRVYFFHTSSAGGPYSDWLFQIYADGSEVGGEAGAPVQLAFGPIVFDANRKQVETDSKVPFYVLWATGASPTPITPILTQFTNHDSESVLKRASQDGCIDRCSRGSGQDFDGDGIDDVYIWRPSLGLWAIRKSATDGAEMLFKQWGLPGDYPMAGDYTGDRLADLVVWRPTNGWWYICPSHHGFDCPLQPIVEAFGLPGDRPVRADLDGDGILDFAVFRPEFGLLFYKSSRTGETVQQQWGLPGDIPVGARPNE